MSSSPDYDAWMTEEERYSWGTPIAMQMEALGGLHESPQSQEI